MPETSKMDRNLALEAVRVTEAAALSASRLMGRGDEKAADQAAVDAMREALNSLAIAGTVVIGEGERDEAPMLFIGEKVGSGNGPVTSPRIGMRPLSTSGIVFDTTPLTPVNVTMCVAPLSTLTGIFAPLKTCEAPSRTVRFVVTVSPASSSLSTVVILTAPGIGYRVTARPVTCPRRSGQ